MSTQPSFKDLVAANRRAGRLEEPPAAKASARKNVLAGMHLPPDVVAQAQTLAREEDRSVSSFMRRIYMRGLASYLAEHGCAPATQQ